MKLFALFFVLLAVVVAHSGAFAKQKNGVVPHVPPSSEPAWWTLEEMAALVQDPSTDPALAEYLQSILDAVNDYQISGPPTDIQVITKPELIEKPEVPSPLPLVDVDPSPVSTPVDAVFSPLVQLIVNIQQ